MLHEVRFEVLTAVRMPIFLWAVIPCRPASDYCQGSPEDRDS